MARAHRFTATLYRVGMNYCVDVPPGASRAWRGEKKVPVEIEVAGSCRKTTALRRADGSYRVFLETSLREAAGVSAGEEVTLVLSQSVELSEPVVPADLERALTRSKNNRDAWTALTLRQRRDFVRYLEEAKGADTRKKRLARSLETIRERLRRALGKMK
jgi:hypothetical protein